MLLLCLPHHSEVDDRLTGERFYPPEVLRKWKADHEGSNALALAALGSVDEDILIEMLLDVFTPDPGDRHRGGGSGMVRARE